MESSGVRKGAWSHEEDVLLRNCIEKYGEGKWHLVPLRAGLNRCRKSCRLRWLNYLKPDIKRGVFASDEVDLMIRLHNLLGNRWSLIAGRLPGRTSNDVKNFWHTQRFKKMVHFPDEGRDKPQTHSKTKVLKPRPYKLSKSSPRFELKTTAAGAFDTQVSTSSNPSSRSPQPNDDIAWWESLLSGHAQMDQETDFSICSSGGERISSLWAEQTATETKGTMDGMVEQVQGGEGDFPFDVGFWDNHLI
ncbi:hypothetical protein AAG906_035791 [Vitis piasezkii]